MFAKDLMSRKEKIKNGILLIIILVLYIVGVHQYMDMRRNYRSVTVRLEDQPITKEKTRTIMEEMKEMEEESSEDTKSTRGRIPNITAYEKEEHITVTNDNLGRERQITFYRVCGSMEQILPCELLRGNYAYQEDYVGCVIDKNTAYRLFGSYDIIGKCITVSVIQQEGETTRTQYKNYYIRGILSTSQPIVMIQAKEDTTQFYSMQLDYGNSSRGREYAQQLLMVYQVSAEYQIVDQNLIVRLTGNLLLIPWLILTIVTGTRTIRKWNHIFNNQKQEWLHMLKNDLSILPTLVCIITLGITGSQFGFFPLQYIPTKWSDFNCVSRTIAMIRQHSKEFEYLTPSMREIILRGKVETLALLIGGILVLFWILYERRRMKNE